MSSLTVDIPYCASSYLMHRTICDASKCFSTNYPPRLFGGRGSCDNVFCAKDLTVSLKRQVQSACADGKAALALSGGIDSAILAKYMPEGSKAYTFKCIVPGKKVQDESPRAAAYAQECGLDHEIIPIYWEDAIALSDDLMKHKGAPIHSIEVQIYKASLKAKSDGFDKLIFGESADLNYGGLSGLLSREWKFGDYVDRYSYVLPYKVLRDPRLVLDPFVANCRDDGFINVREHHRNEFFTEAMGSYTNATELASIELVTPYASTWMACDMDIDRIRHGENKYLVREVFNDLYPTWEQPEKLPMPRPMDEWLADWSGPVRDEFWPGCAEGMTGDQKWLLWSLERFLNIIQ